MLKKYLSVFIFLVGFVGFSQVSVDSLQSLFNQGKYQDIVSLTKESLVKSGIKDTLSIAQMLSIQSNAFYELRKYKQAIRTANASIELAPNTEAGKNLKGMMLFDRAFSEYALEKYQVSYRSVKQAEEVLATLRSPNLDYLLSIYADIAGTSIQYGYLDEAEYYILKGLEVYKKNQDQIPSSENTAAKDVLFQYKLVQLYGAQKLEKKLILQMRSFTRLQRGRVFNAIEQLMYAVSLNLVGDFYLNNRDSLQQDKALKEAEKYLNKALLALDTDKFPSNELQFKFNLAKKYRYAEEYKNALQLNQEILNKAEKGDSRIPFFYAQKGMIHLNRGHFEEAEKSFINMISTIHKGEDKLQRDFSNFSPSEVLNHTGLLVETPQKILDAFPGHLRAQSLCAQMYQLALIQFKNCYQNAEFSVKLKNYYYQAIEGILSTQKGRKFEFLLDDMESIENRLAWREFLQNRKHSLQTLPDSIFNKELDLRNQIVLALKNKDSLKVIELEKEVERHQKYVKKSFPVISESMRSSFNTEKFRKTLSRGTCVLKYKKLGAIMYLFQITKDTTLIHEINYDKKIQNQLETYVRTIRERGEDKELGALIRENIIPFSIDTYDQLFVLPDHALNHLSFETLVDKDGEYLVFSKSISYALHLIFINNQRERTSSEIQVYQPDYSENITDLTTIALRGAQKEAEQLSQLFDTELFHGEDANVQTFFKQAPKAKILHLSMHAKMNQEEPELSYFLFSKEGEEKLYLESLYGAKLQADIAVLSACNTGSGNMDALGTYATLQRSFTFAGVSSTVSSLWEAPDDATQEIIVSFYGFLKKGMPKSEALQKAKLEYLKRNDDPYLTMPYYWASFVISGDVSPMSGDVNFTYYLLGLLFLLILFFGNFRKIFKKN